MPSSWTDLDRPPLSAARLRVAVEGGLWGDLRVLETTVSTNADVVAAAAQGAPEGLVVVAEHQVGGRGRLDRRWESPPRSGVLMSVLLRPQVPAAALPLLPLVAGTAAVEAVRAVAHVDAALKWPNDLLVAGRKLGGVLVERTSDGAVVIGMGINVSTRRAELPVDTATSLALEGGGTDREPLLKELLRALERRYLAFATAEGAPESVLPSYREICETINRRVAMHVPGGEPVTGTAVAVDDDGRLVVEDDEGHQRAWSAGDVIHVRAED